MTGVARKSRLGACVNRRDGVTFEKAVKDADVAVLTVRPKVEASIEDCIDRLALMISDLSPAPTRQALKDIQALGVHIAGHAGLFDRYELGRAAYSLCMLIDELLDGAPDNLQAMRLHLQAVQLLRRPKAIAAADRVKIVQALGDLVEHRRRRTRDDEDRRRATAQ